VRRALTLAQMKRALAALAATTLVALGSASAASAAQRYASPTGTANDFCTALLPCDIVTAINGITANMPSAGDEVILESGTYYQPGTTSTPLSTELDPAVTLDIHGVAGDPMPVINAAVSGNEVLLLNQGSSLSASDLAIEQTGDAAGIFAGAGTFSQLFIRAGGASPEACIADQDLTDSVCDGDGTSTYGIQDNYSCNSEPETYTFNNVDAYGSGAADGIWFDDQGTCATTVDLTNVIARGGPTGYDLEAWGLASGSVSMTASHSDYVTVHTDDTATITTPGTAGNIEGAPTLVDPATGNFDETAASPTIDAGLTSSANGSIDVNGAPRTEGGLTDIGATEYSAAPTVSAAAPSAITSLAASLNGTVDPGNAPTTYSFSYGPTAALGESTPAATLTPSVSAEPVSASIAGLSPGAPYYYELTATNADGSATTSVASFTALPAPALSGLKFAPSRFRAAKGGASIAKAKKHPTGSLVSYDDSQAATTTFTVKRKLSGVLHDQKCVAPGHHQSHKHPKPCTRLVTLGTFTHDDSAGANSFRFSGAVGGRALHAGHYVLSGVPETTTSGGALTADFTVIA
jgi:hypothetical protein